MEKGKVSFAMSVAGENVAMSMGPHELLILQAALDHYTKYAEDNNWWDTEPLATNSVKAAIDYAVKTNGFSLPKVYETEGT